MRVATVGAGIAGLTAALALARTGHAVTVMERAEPIEPVGAGIQVSPNAAKVLARLGLGHALNAHASAPREIVMRDGYDARILARVPLGAEIERHHGAPYLSIHRGDLQGVLIEAARAAGVELRTGIAVTGATPDGTVRSDGTGEAFDLVIGADGVRSAVRAAVRGEGAGRDAEGRGATAWRALVRTPALPRALAGPRTGLWLGAEGHVVHYPVRSGTLTNVVAVVPGAAGPGEEGPEATFRGWSRELRGILAACGDWRPWPTPRIDARGPWRAGRVVLIGDAAHAMWPYAAQGGAMGIEDGWTLAAALADGGADALPAWEAERRARVARVAALAVRNRRIYHARGPLRLARDLALRRAPTGLLMRSMDAIYGWEPPAIAGLPRMDAGSRSTTLGSRSVVPGSRSSP